MKSPLALNLLALLSLIATLNVVGQTVVSATETVSPATTTAQSPSLRVPHRSASPTRVMSTQRRTPTVTASSRQRQAVARSSKTPVVAQATSFKRVAAVDDTLQSKANPNSSRPLRSASINAANIRSNSGARQNRSLQSALSSPAIASASASASATVTSARSSNSLTAGGNHQQKHERIDRRHHFRTSQQSSSQEPTTPKTQASMIAFGTDRHKPTILAASHRQSRESSMPLKDVDVDVDVDGADGADGGESKQHELQAQRNSTEQRQTVKTPRMIHRLVAGHIQNAEGRSSYQVSAVSGNNTILKSTTTPKSMVTLSQQTNRPTKTSSRYSSSSPQTVSTSTSTTTRPVRLQTIFNSPSDSDDDREDDEALLDDPGDFDNWDNGILRLSAGSGKENSKLKKHSKVDDSKKTLADQVRDGKYGLIEKELFRREPKRPGVLSYLPNKEVPVDNEHNYGGLQEDDIWLAEDHLLVIKGGSLNEERPHEEPWPPIDDYDAPGRQIKIPPNPKVPPPFPVQLEENGPVQFIGNNKFTVVYPVANESIPVYTAGPETDTTPSENDSDNEKNTIARPGTPQDVAGGEPHYVYPEPYPPWLFNNQTFVNPLLSNARPITFPGLGPFPFARNGSLGNINGTDFLDEDDPNLYYPPAYSFVYKNNYTSSVPPGPLVPGIVLPPPANQFSKLEKSERMTSPISPIPPRQRTPSTTVSTTTSTIPTKTTTQRTTTTSTTTQSPFRAVITKISEYTPKIINITPATLTVSTAIPSTPISSLPSSLPSGSLTTPRTSSIPIEPVPVPVAIPVPVYPGRPYPSQRPNVLSFVPTTPEPARDTLSKSNPIYYEYFEAKRQPIKTNIIDDFLASTVEPPHSPKPIKLYATSKRPFKTQQQRNYLQPINPQPQSQSQPQPQRQLYNDNIVYITPKPEVRYKPPPKASVLKPRPLENFEHEVNALRETLRYYQNQQLRDNSIPRTPKVKPIYEFSFDASKNIQRPSEGNINDFRPPVNFDEEPFKPMVTYSPPMNDENSFSPMAFDKVDIETSQKLLPKVREQEEQSKYQPTTTLVPVPQDSDYQARQPQLGRLKKQRLSAKYLQEPFIETAYDRQLQRQPVIAQRPWVAVPKVPLDTRYEPVVSQTPEEQSQRYEQYQYPAPKSRGYTGYYYGPPPPPTHSRQNNRFYDEPFQPPARKIISYRQRPNIHYHQSQQHQPQQNYWNLENDTYVNYAPNRPPLNPDAEFINPYQTVPVSPYVGHGRYPPPAVSHQSQYYAPPRQQIPLHRDILVNYRHPLPPINPDSEFIGHPHVVRNQANQIYRSDSYRNLSPPPLLDNGAGDEQANVYYVSPKYRRANNSNNNNNNVNNNNGNNNNAGYNNDGSNVNKQGREGRSSSGSSSSSNNSNTNANGDINNGK